MKGFPILSLVSLFGFSSKKINLHFVSFQIVSHVIY
jgi:hypothetical protein